MRNFQKYQQNSSTDPDPQISDSQRRYFLGTPGETRKNFLTTVVQSFLKSLGIRVLALTSSAVAAKLLDDGWTAHSALKTPIPIPFEIFCSIEAIFQLSVKLMRTKLVILNTVFMTHRHDLGAVDRTFKDILRSVISFAGISTLRIGDFRRILPMVRAANRSQIISACL